MKDDYLWDKTGEPDPEIQKLEEILGALRYQPRPLELPAQVRIIRPRTLLSRMAIAAAVAAIFVGGASWWLWHRQDASVSVETAAKPPAVENVKAPSETTVAPASPEVVKSTTANGTSEKTRKRIDIHNDVLAANRKARPFKNKVSELTARDRAEAQAAKEQLLLALRVASSKLSLAQKKTQVGYPGSLIRNQHKVG